MSEPTNFTRINVTEALTVQDREVAPRFANVWAAKVIFSGAEQPDVVHVFNDDFITNGVTLELTRTGLGSYKLEKSSGVWGATSLIAPAIIEDDVSEVTVVKGYTYYDELFYLFAYKLFPYPYIANAAALPAVDLNGTFILEVKEYVEGSIIRS